LDVFEAVRTRRSIRAYQDKPVEKEKLTEVLEAGRLSPSAVNYQPWHFIAVTDKVARESLLPAYNHKWFVDAPAIIVACALPENAWSRQDDEEYWKVDVSIALQSMILAARGLGLGTCWIGAFNEEEVKKALGIPKEVRVVAMTPLGYAAEQKGPVVDRKHLDEIVHSDRW
jgi:nitroreductase